MLNIIDIGVDQFLSRKGKALTDDILDNKYKELFGSYACFHTTTLPLPSNTPHVSSTSSHNNHHHHKRYPPSNNRRFPQVSKPPISKPKTIPRMITSILNVINKDNYHKVLTKLRLLKNESNIELIAEEILQKSAMQVFYQKLYCELLKDILSMCCPIERSLMLHKIEHFVMSFIEKKDWLTHHAQDDDYEEFCVAQKQKTRVLASNDLVMRLVTIGNLSPSILSSYIETLYNDFKEMLMLNNKDKATNIILVLEMLINICASQRDKVRDIIGIDIKSYRCIDQDNKKMLFLYQDFTKVLG
jgi:hypothetical protein